MLLKREFSAGYSRLIHCFPKFCHPPLTHENGHFWPFFMVHSQGIEQTTMLLYFEVFMMLQQSDAKNDFLFF